MVSLLGFPRVFGTPVGGVGAGGSDLPAYYVSTAGNDSTGTGTAAAPWRSIDKALATIPITGNVQIRVATGTYTENTNSSNALQLSRAFTSPVYVRPLPGATVTMSGTGTNGLYSIGILSGAANVVFENMTLTNNAEPFTVFGFTNAIAINAIGFRNCTITNNAAGGIAVYFNATAAANCFLTNCAVTANGTGNAIAISITGRAATTSYVTGMTLSNCIVTGVQYALRLPNSGYVSNLLVSGGTYTATGSGTGAAIGLRGAAASGFLTNITISGVTVRGNGRGIDLGASTLAAPLTNLNISNCDVDVTANKQTGVLLGAAITGCSVNGGTYNGGEAGSGYGGFFVIGNDNTNFSFTNAVFSSAAPDPVSNRVLALGIGGTDGIIVRGCTFTGNGRAVTLQAGAINALIENNTSTAEDMGLRVGNDSSTTSDNHDVIFRNNTVTSLETVAVIVGNGAWNITIEDNTLIGGPGVFRFRGSTSNANILVQRNTCSRNPAYAGAKVGALQCFGMRGVTFTDNEITSDFTSIIELNLQDALKNQGNTITDNQFSQSGGKVFVWATANDGDNNTVDDNTYTLTNAATLGDVRGTTGITTLAGLQGAWAGYTNPNNDAASVVN